MTRPAETFEVLLLDIEGTTTSISFVYDVLFPYARRDFAATFAGGGLLAERWHDAAVQDGVRALGGGAGTHGPIAAAAAALALMHADVKDTGLKALQGLVWESGYARGAIRGHVYPDVAPALARASARGVRTAIYSSGSVHAQRLLFGHSEAGDLTPHLSGYFDTTIGAKKDPASYAAIAARLGVAAGEILFISDNLDEARAAATSGLQVRVAVRPGNPSLPPGHGFVTLETLAEVV